MNNSKRSFIKNLGIMSATSAIIPTAMYGNNTKEEVIKEESKRPKTIFFDVNETLLDLEPLKKSVVEILGNKTELGTLWFTTMLQYSLVSTVANQYHDFGKIGAAALIMVAKNNGIELNNEEAKNAVKPILSLEAHPEVKEALTLLKKNNYQLVSFTNSSNNGVAQQFKYAGLENYFDERISVEDYGKFKPDTDVYHWAARKMQVENKDCLLVAAHGWDIAGALWAGWQAAFIARPGQQLYPLAPSPQINKSDLLAVAKELIKL